jgi:cationic peptide transport system permease protein
MIAFMGTGENNLLLAIWLSLIPRIVRATYQCVHQEITKEYIIASRLDGAKQGYLLYHAILPNILPTLIAEITRAISIAILDIATLGFLGLAGNSHTPEWGSMLGSSTELIYLAPWTITLPGLAILLSVLTINFIGDGLQQALNMGTD